MRDDKIDVIIWDWNGTLLDDVDISLGTINSLLGERGLELLDEDSYREVFTFPVRDYYTKIGFDFEKEPFDIPARKFIDIYNLRVMDCGLYPEVISVLNHCRETGHRQFILSAMEQKPLVETIQKNNIHSYFAGVYGLDNHYAHSKIEAGIRLMDENSINPGRTVVVGDTIHDFEVAKELGCKSILVSGGHQSRDRLEGAGATVVDRVGELLMLLS